MFNQLWMFQLRKLHKFILITFFIIMNYIEFLFKQRTFHNFVKYFLLKLNGSNITSI